MKLLRSSVFAACMLLTVGFAEAAPRIKKVVLEKHTTLSLKLVPDLGTRFVFPFVLDEQDEYVPFTLNITNPAFINDRQEGRNSFVLSAPPVAGGRSILTNVFVTVAGYEITVELATTSDLTQHYSDVVFELGEGVRENLIQASVRQRTKALEQDYQRKFKGLDELAEHKALAKVGALAIGGYSSRSIKEDGVLRLDNGDEITLTVQHIRTYGPYAVFVCELYNDSHTQDIAVQDARVFSIHAGTKQERAIDGAPEMPPRLNARQSMRGTVTVLAEHLAKDEYLRLVINTDKGMVAAQW